MTYRVTLSSAWKLLIASLSIDGVVLLTAGNLIESITFAPSINFDIYFAWMAGILIVASTPLILYQSQISIETLSIKKMLIGCVVLVIGSEFLFGYFTQSKISFISSGALFLSVLFLSTKILNVLLFKNKKEQVNHKVALLPESQKRSTVSVGLLMTRIFLSFLTAGVFLQILKGTTLICFMLIAGTLLLLYQKLIITLGDGLQS